MFFDQADIDQRTHTQNQMQGHPLLSADDQAAMHATAPSDLGSAPASPGTAVAHLTPSPNPALFYSQGFETNKHGHLFECPSPTGQENFVPFGSPHGVNGHIDESKLAAADFSSNQRIEDADSNPSLIDSEDQHVSEAEDERESPSLTRSSSPSHEDSTMADPSPEPSSSASSSHFPSSSSSSSASIDSKQRQKKALKAAKKNQFAEVPAERLYTMIGTTIPEWICAWVLQPKGLCKLDDPMPATADAATSSAATAAASTSSGTRLVLLDPRLIALPHGPKSRELVALIVVRLQIADGYVIGKSTGQSLTELDITLDGTTAGTLLLDFVMFATLQKRTQSTAPARSNKATHNFQDCTQRDFDHLSVIIAAPDAFTEIKSADHRAHQSIDAYGAKKGRPAWNCTRHPVGENDWVCSYLFVYVDETHAQSAVGLSDPRPLCFTHHKGPSNKMLTGDTGRSAEADTPKSAEHQRCVEQKGFRMQHTIHCKPGSATALAAEAKAATAVSSSSAAASSFAGASSFVSAPTPAAAAAPPSVPSSSSSPFAACTPIERPLARCRENAKGQSADQALKQKVRRAAAKDAAAAAPDAKPTPEQKLQDAANKAAKKEKKKAAAAATAALMVAPVDQRTTKASQTKRARTAYKFSGSHAHTVGLEFIPSHEIGAAAYTQQQMMPTLRFSAAVPDHYSTRYSPPFPAAAVASSSASSAPRSPVLPNGHFNHVNVSIQNDPSHAHGTEKQQKRKERHQHQSQDQSITMTVVHQAQQRLQALLAEQNRLMAQQAHEQMMHQQWQRQLEQQQQLRQSQHPHEQQSQPGRLTPDAVPALPSPPSPQSLAQQFASQPFL